MNVLPISYNSVQKYNSVAFKTSQNNNFISDIKQPNEYYCAPCAGANAVISLLKPIQINNSLMVNNLAYYMKTDTKGTTSENLCKGLEKYFNSQGLFVKIDYKGFRDVDKKYKSSDLPDIKIIKKELKDGNQVILNLGVYKKSGENYVRQYGHFVNAVSAGSNGFSFDENSFAVTDPYNKTSGLQYIKFKPILSGKLVHNSDDNEKALTDNAKGFYELSPKFNYFENGETAILNGVIVISKK